MAMEKALAKRKHPRLKDYDYSRPGAYFITICTHNRKNILCNIVGSIHESPEIKLTEKGRIVDRMINNLPQHLNATIDRYVIMPNHIHLIVVITDDGEQRSIHESTLHGRSVISKAIGYIKMNASKEIHKQYGNITVWQRSFYDHIIRNERDYNEIAKYIHENPLRWHYDKLYSDH